MLSIVTPTYNTLGSLVQTIEMLQRYGANFEHIVVDGGSRDGTVEYLRSCRYPNFKFISEPDEGMYDAIQKGFAIAEGSYFGWLNAGDYYYPWTTSVVNVVFQRLQRVEWITGVPSVKYESKNVEISSYVPIYIRALIRSGFHNGRDLPLIQQESTFWRRDLWEKSNASKLLLGQGRGKGFATDYRLWRRFAEFAELRTVTSPLAAFAITPGQISEKHRLKYFMECGLKSIPLQPNWMVHQIFKAYSIVSSRKAISISKHKF